MSFKVQVGPPQISIHQGHTVLISEQDGQINWPSDKGLYFFDTRVISSAFWDEELGFYAYALDGDKKKVLSVASNAGRRGRVGDLQ